MCGCRLQAAGFAKRLLAYGPDDVVFDIDAGDAFMAIGTHVPRGRKSSLFDKDDGLLERNPNVRYVGIWLQHPKRYTGKWPKVDAELTKKYRLPDGKSRWKYVEADTTTLDVNALLRKIGKPEGVTEVVDGVDSLDSAPAMDKAYRTAIGLLKVGGRLSATLYLGQDAILLPGAASSRRSSSS